jgi:hypothetical protein
MAQKIIAGLTILVCVVLLLRLCVGARLRYRFDAASRSAWRVTRRKALNAWHWRASRREAKQAAVEAIQRAQRKAANAFERDGNVYKPDAFQKSKQPRDPRDPHDPRNLH